MPPMTTATFQTTRPATGTREWAASNVNIQDGCEHDCLYCYAKWKDSVKGVVGLPQPTCVGRDA